MKSPLGAAQLAVQVFSDPAQTEPVDVVMFAVKLDIESAAEQLRPVVGQHTVIIPFQNGVESIERPRRSSREEASAARRTSQRASPRPA